ncbi:MAG: cysteine desulfurase [Flavobacteriales bacterium]|nr:cysteine desulfurase [Flavobacteriales bacterium]
MIYLDNASTTKINNEVLDTLNKSMSEIYGNPSSTHSLGRKSKVAIESARNSIAKIMNCKAKEIIFTSGGTEADNAIIFNALNTLNIERIISSRIEHHAVIDTIKKIENDKLAEVHWLAIDSKGNINLNELKELLNDQKTTLVSLMHVNNEIGNISDINKLGEICKKNGAIFHSDTVQGISHLKYDLSNIPVDFICASAHKFGGPKGVGFIYKRDGVKYSKQLFGGEQERDFRAGTENVSGIVAMQKALEIAHSSIDENNTHLYKLKSHLINSIKEKTVGVKFNGLSDNMEGSIYTIVNINLPLSKPNKMIVFQFDLKGVAISEGSACSAGGSLGSHVLKEIIPDYKNSGSNIRISMSADNTIEEIDTFVEILKEIIEK